MLPSLDALRARIYRLGFSYFPAYWTTGAKLVDLAPDFSSARVALPLNWRTRNVVGTTFGGSIYGAVDPVYMVLLRSRLGDAFTVWDRAASIEYHEPGRGTLYADFEVPDADVRELRSLAPGESTERVYEVAVVDADSEVHAEVEKTLYVRRDE
ncbi:DUF4442 domain-containing protein [Halobacterium wangiae]|uniref:DUF4442 domain-containing protein n=1 Tax=Halobacterium wangiae TaxID=2902623 RepID=UPI001E555EF6|nr:DUF4442 domain-containing protein [Halobacterium wangiae]